MSLAKLLIEEQNDLNTVPTFFGQYRFLSNFWYATVYLDGVAYPSTEHAYQAAKTLNATWRRSFEIGTPAQAKALGRKVPLREDWEQVKLAVMEDLLRQKFARNENLRNGLLATEGKTLIEGNHWNDTFWGVCNGVGENHLGKLLMKIRDEYLKRS